MKKYIFAPDSFKGSLTAKEQCEILTDTAEQLYRDTAIKMFGVFSAKQ